MHMLPGDTLPTHPGSSGHFQVQRKRHHTPYMGPALGEMEVHQANHRRVEGTAAPGDEGSTGRTAGGPFPPCWWAEVSRPESPTQKHPGFPRCGVPRVEDRSPGKKFQLVLPACEFPARHLWGDPRSFLKRTF